MSRNEEIHEILMTMCCILKEFTDEFRSLASMFDEEEADESDEESEE